MAITNITTAQRRREWARTWTAIGAQQQQDWHRVWLCTRDQRLRRTASTAITLSTSCRRVYGCVCGSSISESAQWPTTQRVSAWWSAHRDCYLDELRDLGALVDQRTVERAVAAERARAERETSTLRAEVATYRAAAELRAEIQEVAHVVAA